MGSRISFRPRARGCAEDGGAEIDPEYVSRLEKKWKFIEGVTGTPAAGQVQVGAGTAFPVQVTIDQFFEIAYRVRDARVTGSVDLDVDFDPSTSGTVSYLFTGADPTTQDNWWDGPIGEYTYRAYSVNQADASDETEMWSPDLDRSPNTVQNFVQPSGVFVNSDSFGSSFVGYMAYAVSTLEGDLGAYFDFNSIGAVAVYDPSGGGSVDPFDPSNELWINLYVEGFDYSPIVGFGFSSVTSLGWVSVGSVALVLESGTVNIPIYASSLDLTSGSSTLTITATDWWPYAKPGGGDFWTPGTGELA